MFVGPHSSAGIKFPSQSFLYFSNCNKGDVKNLRKKINQCPAARPVLPAIELFATMAHGCAPDGTETKWQARTAVRACNPVIFYTQCLIRFSHASVGAPGDANAKSQARMAMRVANFQTPMVITFFEWQCRWALTIR